MREGDRHAAKRAGQVQEAADQKREGKGGHHLHFT